MSDLSEGTALIKELCGACKQHVETLACSPKSKKANDAAFHYFVGVAHTLTALQDPRAAHVERFVVYFVATRGYSEVLKNVP